MALSDVFHTVRRSFELLVLSWTAHARLVRAQQPSDFRQILKRSIREVKFHAETLLAILFFMGTTDVEQPYLISSTLACLLLTLLTYTVLEAMSGEALHEHIDSIPLGRALFALLAKLPALGVLSILCALARTETAWNTPVMRVTLCALAAVILLVLALRLRAHEPVVVVAEFSWLAVRTMVVRILDRMQTAYSRVGACLCSATMVVRRGINEKEEDVEAGNLQEDNKFDFSCTSKTSLVDLPALPIAAMLV